MMVGHPDKFRLFEAAGEADDLYGNVKRSSGRMITS
jgi:hypothetical protein